MKRLVAMISVLALMAFLACQVSLAGYSDLPDPGVLAAAAILADAKTGELLFEKNIHARRMPASLTKMMTCILALEHAEKSGCMDEIVTVTESSLVGMAPDGSMQGLKPGEELTYRDLVYCAMIASANDGCNVLAEYISGSVDAFVAAMNARAEAIGMSDSHFVNTHGLPDPDHYSTAFDIYLLCREAMKNKTFMDMAHTETYTVPPTNLKPEGRTLNTTNRLISKRTSPEYLYPHARGIKTGHTIEAGYCLASSADKDGVALISVVLGAEREESGIIRSFVETKELFEWGFDNFTHKRLLAKTEVIASVPLIQGLNSDSVELVPAEEITALVPRSVSPENINRVVKVFEPDGALAPILKGQVMGTLSLNLEGRDFGTVNLVAMTAEERDEAQKVLDDFFEVVSEPWIKWAVAGVVAAIVLYIAITIMYNVHRRKKLRTGYSSYKGKKRHRR